MQLDGRLLRERKSLESQRRIKLAEMKAHIPYRRPLQSKYSNCKGYYVLLLKVYFIRLPNNL